MAEEMFRPPVNRAMRALDKSFFRKDIVVSALKVQDKKRMADVLRSLRKSSDLLIHRDFSNVRHDAVSGGSGAKCVLLNPTVNMEDRSSWSPTVTELVEKDALPIIPYRLQLDYDFWSASDILHSVLPEELHDEIPTSFNQAGHIAHLNLRPQQLPYRHLIGEVILSKGSGVRTVINKTQTLDSENEFRVIDYELLAGEDEMQTELRECGSVFRIDYAKVFWNSRLQTEHERMAAIFRPGEAICDVMAGVGPFAVPAGRKECFVWANDLNPDCYAALADAVEINKVSEFVRAFNQDGHSFIRDSAQRLLNHNRKAQIPIKFSRSKAAAAGQSMKPRYREVPQPRVFSHYVMNLPSTAIDFLPDFIGLYAGLEALFEGAGASKLPMIHCYCFDGKAETEAEELAVQENVCRRLSEKIGCEVRLDHEDTMIWDVRDVAPNKRQLCASFRLPPEAAFKQPPSGI